MSAVYELLSSRRTKGAAMSLFKARDWWTTTSGYEEFHDLGCLCVANIDNNKNGHGKKFICLLFRSIDLSCLDEGTSLG